MEIACSWRKKRTRTYKFLTAEGSIGVEVGEYQSIPQARVMEKPQG